MINIWVFNILNKKKKSEEKAKEKKYISITDNLIGASNNLNIVYFPPLCKIVLCTKKNKQ